METNAIMVNAQKELRWEDGRPTGRWSGSAEVVFTWGQWVWGWPALPGARKDIPGEENVHVGGGKGKDSTTPQHAGKTKVRATVPWPGSPHANLDNSLSDRREGY